MEIVVDASAIIAVITNQPTKDRLVTLTEGADLIAPHSIHWEIGNAFSAMLKQKRVTVEEAVEAVHVYRSILLRFVEVELDQSLQIAQRLNIYAYDAYLIRCAQKFRAPLLTLDKGLLYSAKGMNVAVLEV